MLTTRFTPGSPIWLELSTLDVDASVHFYQALFDWDFQPLGPEFGGYGTFVTGGRSAAALYPCTAGDDEFPCWTLYFHTADAEALAKAVEGAGGTVRRAPEDVFTNGREAHFVDPSGVRFAAWQPGDTKGLEVVNEVGSLAWTELLTDDAAKAEAFYTAVFAWRFQAVPMAGGAEYTVITPAAQDEGGETGGLVGVDPASDMPGHDAAPSWYPYFEVADCDAAVARAVAAGGSVVVPAMDLDGVGRMAMIADPAGVRCQVITSAVPAPPLPA
ncbi:VOC family protein [Yinghuangia soli]|uniref:VOC family protein n=1 Tax=Yinghuangia soli TaxID=2908204 RepID=A0AA41PWB2_9ACTN|nr:VOC family protein [Yinghuangia soli]MCF2525672.1 VOC family protein [Yinghuangia soli]